MTEKHNNIRIIDHPLVTHKLAMMRNHDASISQFRQLAGEIAMLLTYEITRHWPTETQSITTPMAPMSVPMIEETNIVLIPILRAGYGLLDGVLRLLPNALVGHIGLFRDPETHQAVEYYCKLPPNLEQRDIILVDPMLATGNTAVAALDIINKHKPKSIKFMCLLAVQEGLDAITKFHPNVEIYAAALDPVLNSKKYIVPGLGDAGDRMFGTFK